MAVVADRVAAVRIVAADKAVAHIAADRVAAVRIAVVDRAAAVVLAVRTAVEWVLSVALVVVRMVIGFRSWRSPCRSFFMRYNLLLHQKWLLAYITATPPRSGT